jgi:hypothetical protein
MSSSPPYNRYVFHTERFQPTERSDMATEFHLTYMGETLDVFDHAWECERAREDLVSKIMRGRLPDLLTAEDFDDHEDCMAQFEVVQRTIPDFGYAEPL